MFILKPEVVVRLAQTDSTVLNMRRDYHKALYSLRDFPLNRFEETDVPSFVKEHTELEIPNDVLKNILDLYPEARIRIVQNYGKIDTDVGDIILDAISHFFLGCSWPTGADNVDMPFFMGVLKAQAKTFNIF